ncbi:uncharacterized protein LOC129769457 isoform X2 [Toxorhynchites rutilus septentrionalis]|nr:uncharacterized protein LOC129769457 isoform X2 [Toxorhynchites rutilus septentrionalis]
MNDEWVVSPRRTVDSLSAGSSSSASSPHSSLQHIPAYNYYDSVSQQHYLHYQPTSSHRRSSATKAMDVSERNYYHRMMERTAYVNRSFMHHNENEHQLKQLQRGRGSGGDSMLDSSHHMIDYVDRRNDRRRHSMHHITQPTVSKMEDLKQRFDEYSSSAAVGRGGGASGGGSKRPSRQNSGIPFAIGGPVDGGRLNFGYSGSKTLDVYEPQQRTVSSENRQKGSSAKTPKRGSRSSQGSTDSSHSSHSASSGSLLLTVANLENFAKIHKKHESSYGTSRTMEEYLSSTVGIVPTAAIMEAVGDKYNSNIILTHTPGEDIHLAEQTGGDHHRDHHSGILPTGSAIISIEEVVSHHQQQQQQLQQDQQQTKSTKTKDPDSVSVASSTHFTMINGVGGPQRLPKSGICSRGHQITILIVTMSFVFMIGICAAVFFLEMRAREMPR